MHSSTVKHVVMVASTYRIFQNSLVFFCGSSWASTMSRKKAKMMRNAVMYEKVFDTYILCTLYRYMEYLLVPYRDSITCWRLFTLACRTDCCNVMNQSCA